MRKLVFIILAVILIGSLAGCSTQSSSQVQKPLKVGVTAGPHAEIMDVVKKVAEKDGLKIEIVEFNDYIQPNIALNQGDIDVNSYQHQPWLDNQVKDRGYQLTSIAKTIIFPMGIYSKKVTSLADVKEGAIVAIPNDPTNGSRALAILEKGGLIKLNPNAGIKASVNDIIDNPKNLKIKELDAAQIPRSLEDTDLAAINTNYAMVAGLLPNRDAIILEDGNSPYANILAARIQDKDNTALTKLIKAYQSDEVKSFVAEHFKGAALPAW